LEIDQLVPDRLARAELGGVTAMTFYRRDSNPEAGWPPKIKMGNRNYRSRRALEEYKQRLMAEALKALTVKKKYSPLRLSDNITRRRGLSRTTPPLNDLVSLEETNGCQNSTIPSLS
jgi:hypothetical protein